MNIETIEESEEMKKMLTKTEVIRRKVVKTTRTKKSRKQAEY